MSVPKLRFKEFDGDWFAQKYKDALTIKYGKDHKLLEDGEIPVYGTGGLMRYVNQYLHDGESILIGRKGTIDQPKYVNEKFWTVDTLFYSEIKQDIYPLFIYQHALQVNWLGLNEATGVPSLNTTSINNIDIYLPSKIEQTKIATFLSAVDEKISQLTQKHELLSQYKQGMMQKLFSQQIRFKADDGSEFGEWEETKIGNVFSVTSGSTPLRSDERFFKDADIDWVKTTDLNNGLIVKIEEKISQIALKETSVKILPRGTVFVAMYGGFNQIGRTGLLVKEAACNQALSAIYPNEKINSYFLLAYLNHKVDDWKNFAASSRKDPNITKSDVLSFPFEHPSDLEEQTKIANFLSAIDQKIEVVVQQIEHAKQWKKGLLQQMFV